MRRLKLFRLFPHLVGTTASEYPLAVPDQERRPRLKCSMSHNAGFVNRLSVGCCLSSIVCWLTIFY